MSKRIPDMRDDKTRVIDILKEELARARDNWVETHEELKEFTAELTKVKAQRDRYCCALEIVRESSSVPQFIKQAITEELGDE